MLSCAIAALVSNAHFAKCPNTCTSQMFAFHLQRLQCFLILNKFRTVNSTVQVLEMIWVLNELIQANEMVFMNFWFIKHYGACFGNDFDAVMNYFKHIEYSMYIEYKQKN